MYISQDHYDWGLRAIKSVLVVAGSLKREDRSRPEEQVLISLVSSNTQKHLILEDMNSCVQSLDSGL